MAQYARPSSDIQTTNWNNSGVGAYYQDIDEVTPSDSDYVYTNAMAETALIVGLNAVNDPGSSTNHIIRFRAKSAKASKGPESCECVLYQGTTQIATTGVQTLTRDAYNSFQYELSPAEADAITDYSALRLHFIPSPGSGKDDEIHVSWAEFQVPDAVQEYIYNGNIGVSVIPSSTRVLEMVFVGALSLSLLTSSARAVDRTYNGALQVELMPSHVASMEYPYVGALPLMLIPEATYLLEQTGGAFIYDGALQLALQPSHTVIRDMAYGGALSVSLMPSCDIIREMLYHGDIPLVISLVGISGMEKAYMGGLQLILVPMSEYGLTMNLFVYCGALDLTLIPSHIAVREYVYKGNLSLGGAGGVGTYPAIGGGHVIQAG